MPALILAAPLAVFFVLVAASAAFDGFVLSILWQWFIVPTFRLPELHLPAAIGITLIAGCLTAKVWRPESEAFYETCVVLVGIPIMAVIIGWVVHFFV
ncbi:MAG: hypothetical protein KGI78_04040 [Patescibacteria group bacterium]|nr:hypothetical protein [Patescibacteria group bacterium]MDE1943881.1 hypothetical protein [Patescibacteria group bacterium]MDE1944959.1 hypothetical protein [Patescibacteria group bacterium]MDE2057990.1 hypothetical protein [Patescibacteria group bacterium]